MAILMSKSAPNNVPRPWPNSSAPANKWREGLNPDQAGLTDSALMIPEPDQSRSGLHTDERQG